jgi:hypothetical protein
LKKFSLAILLVISADFAHSDALFESNDPLNITLEAPLIEIRKTRDKTIKYSAQLTHEEKIYDLNISVRGNKRLSKKTCKNPPLWLDFKKKQTKDTLFAHQKHLKLVVLCKDSNLHHNYLRGEYLIYKMYEEIAPVNFRVRWLTITYVEEDGSSRSEPAFLIERKARVGKRVGMMKVDEEEIDHTELDKDTSALVNLFNYIVSNSDFSLVLSESGSCCHNAKLFLDKESNKYFPVLYDFDSSGVINARYAVPNPSIKVKKVTTRVYRGFCHHNSSLDYARSTLNSAKSKFTSLITDDTILSKAFIKKMSKFIEGSFESLEHDGKFQSRIVSQCRE